jgi:hypothetical protein
MNSQVDVFVGRWDEESVENAYVGGQEGMAYCDMNGLQGL